MTPFRISRRETLIGSFLGLAGTGQSRPTGPLRATQDREAKRATLRFGLIADVHQDVMHDGVERITSFVTAMEGQDVDFVLQLGDFCQPKAANDAFIEAWRRFDGPRYHVIGNHDMDGGFSRDQVVAYYGMPSRYYSFDVQGLHCIVLDGNDPGGSSGGYARFIAKDQLDWLVEDLKQNPSPTVVFVHQPLDSSDGVDNR
ncbi:MAG: Icc protein, partial [Planctomycetota bacterium]